MVDTYTGKKKPTPETNKSKNLVIMPEVFYLS